MSPPHCLTLVLATHNAGKVREFTRLLGNVRVVLRDLRSFGKVVLPPEDGETYLDNARTKALAVARATSLPAMADDSGLEVDALNGAPGVLSARFAGVAASDADRVALLLQRLQDLPTGRRTARFRCVLVVAHPDGRTLSREGVCEGHLTTEPRGVSGFGYDPIFYYPPAGCTFAQMDPDDKNAVSHRAKAVDSIRPHLLNFLRDRPETCPRFPRH
jgi:XTP/dITP diphosphohydrolase